MAGQPVRPKRGASAKAAAARDAEWRVAADGPGPTAESDRWLATYRAQEEAQETLRRERAAATAPDFSRFTASFREQLAIAPEDRGWAIEGLARPGHIATLPSQRKTGKTTFEANLAWSGVDGEPFLDRFDCALDGTVAIVNAEMTTDDYLWTFRRLGIQNDDRLFILHCLDEHLRINLLSDVVCERFVKWLRERDAEWLFLDPWKNFLSWAGLGLNDNSGAGDLLIRIQEIATSASLGLVVIAMHTAQNGGEIGAERAKGAGEVEDGADALWRYTAAGNEPDAPRTLVARGRGGVSASVVVSWDAETDRLSCSDGDRQSAIADYRAKGAAEALELELIRRDANRIKAGEFDAVIPGDNKVRQSVRMAAVRSGLVVETVGKGNTKWYSMPDE